MWIYYAYNLYQNLKSAKRKLVTLSHMYRYTSIPTSIPIFGFHLLIHTQTEIMIIMNLAPACSLRQLRRLLQVWGWIISAKIKRTVSRKMDIFLRSKHSFCVCAVGFQGLLKAVHFIPIQPRHFLSFQLLLWNYLLILKMITEVLLRIPFFL